MLKVRKNSSFVQLGMFLAGDIYEFEQTPILSCLSIFLIEKWWLNHIRDRKVWVPMGNVMLLLGQVLLFIPPSIISRFRNVPVENTEISTLPGPIPCNCVNGDDKMIRSPWKVSGWAKNQLLSENCSRAPSAPPAERICWLILAHSGCITSYTWSCL